jgi:hypothetical protein
LSKKYIVAVNAHVLDYMKQRKQIRTNRKKECKLFLTCAKDFAL